MRRRLVLFLAFVLSVCLFSGCSAKKKDDGTLDIVCTIFPEYDWVKELTKGAENVNIKLLANNGTDMHSYQPSADDMIMIKDADVFIYVGGESDAWVKDVLKNTDTTNMKIINLMELLGDNVMSEKDVAMTSFGGEADDIHDDHDIENDEHVWLSLERASFFCTAIYGTLCEVDEANKSIYENNYNNYIRSIDNLNQEYHSIFDRYDNKVVVLADRHPFAYLFDEYDIDCFAAFEGCAAETEASFDTVIYLADRLDEFELNSIFILEGSKDDLAKTIIDNSKNKDREVLTINSLQSVTQKDIDGGLSYIGVMEDNLSTISGCFTFDRD